ncbi:MAG: PAS domain-containing sensor histidine kinase [Nitrospira sp.]
MLLKPQLFGNIAQSIHTWRTPLWAFTPGPRWTWAVLVLSIGAIFLLDSVTPLGFVVWMLYLFPLWIAGGMSDRHSSSFIYIIGGICAGLMLLGFWIAPPGIDPFIALVNWLIGIGGLGLTTWLLRHMMEQRETLRLNEAELRDFLEGAAIGLHGEGPDGTILWANQAELELLGYDREEYVGHHIREFHVDPPTVEHMLNALSAGHTLYNHEVKLLCKDGTTRDVSIVANVSWKRGRFSHTRCFTRDITALKAAERQQAHLAAIVKSTDDAVISISPDARILTWNKGAEKLLGWTEAQAVGQPKWLFVPPERLKESTAMLETVLLGQAPQHTETQRLRKDGSLVDVSITVSPVLLKGRVIGVSETVRDISARKRAEEALRESEAFNRSLMGASTDCVKVLDLEGKLRHMNPPGQCTMEIDDLGLVCGREWSLLWPEPMQKEIAQSVKEALAGNSSSFEGYCPTVKGTPKWWDVKVGPVRDGERIVHLLSVSRDITARKRAEQALLEANKELEAFSYTVSHDLRAPLRSINGFVKILIEDHGATLNDQARRCLGVIANGANRMGELIDDLLTFSRLSRSSMELRAIDPKVIINEAWLELQQDREGRTIEFIVNDLPRCRADRRLLKQVWSNLLSNALKYTRPRDSARIEIGWSGDAQHSKEIVYWIRDNGVGFDQRYVHQLFGVFQRLHRAEEFEGTGVGLAIVQRIIKRHGGRVSAEGRVDGGATISMTLERVYELDGAGVHLSPIG